MPTTGTRGSTVKCGPCNNSGATRSLARKTGSASKPDPAWPGVAKDPRITTITTAVAAIVCANALLLSTCAYLNGSNSSDAPTGKTCPGETLGSQTQAHTEEEAPQARPDCI